MKRTPIKRTSRNTSRLSSRRATPMAKADRAFSAYIRASRGGCEDDRIHEHKGPLQCAHGFSREHQRTRYDERQVWALCYGAHFYYGRHPLAWDEFMRRHMDEYDAVRALALLAAPIRPDFKAIERTYVAKLAQWGGHE